MKKEIKQLLVAAKITLLIMWPVSAWAAAITFGDQMAQLPLLSLLMTVLLSTVMGATALLHAMKLEYEAKDKIDRLWLFVCSKMLGSNAAGLLVFFMAESWEIRTSYLAGAIMLASFGGVFFIERAFNGFINKYVTPTEQ